MERDLLIELVYPYLAKQCQLLGIEFYQPSEMRWGIRQFAADSNLTEEVYLFNPWFIFLNALRIDLSRGIRAMPEITWC